jgi:hypothetical protein
MIGLSRRQNLYTANNLYIMFIFLALALTSLPQSWVGHNVFAFALIEMVLYWASFEFPIMNEYCFLKFIAFSKNDATQNHFWPDANKRPCGLSKDDADETFIKIQDIVYMDESTRAEMENALRKAHKFQVFEFARMSSERKSDLRASVVAS